MALVEDFLRDQLILQELLAPRVIVLGFVEVGLGGQLIGLRALLVGLRRVDSRLQTLHVGLRAPQRRLLDVHFRGLLDVVGPEQHLAFLHRVALFHVNAGDLTDAFGVDVGEVFLGRLDLPVGGHDGGQVLLTYFACLDSYHASLAPHDTANHQAKEHHRQDTGQHNLLPAFHALYRAGGSSVPGDFGRSFGHLNFSDLHFRHLTHAVKLLSLG